MLKILIDIINQRFSKEDSGTDIGRFLKKAKKFSPFEIQEYRELEKTLKGSAVGVEKRPLGLRLVIISDTHGILAYGKGFEAFMKRVIEYDLCVLLGDITSAEVEVILGIVPKEKIIAVRGNHDSFDVYESYGIENISGSVYTYKGVRIAGIEGSFRYKDEDFPSFTQRESLELACSMEQGADVVISHDRVFSPDEDNLVRAGLIGITYYICKNAVQWHIHGHIHKSYEDIYCNGTAEKSVYQCEYVEI